MILFELKNLKNALLYENILKINFNTFWNFKMFDFYRKYFKRQFFYPFFILYIIENILLTFWNCGKKHGKNLYFSKRLIWICTSGKVSENEGFQFFPDWLDSEIFSECWICSLFWHGSIEKNVNLKKKFILEFVRYKFSMETC